MKLVGATNWFIRIPYITRLIPGLIGAVCMLLVTAFHLYRSTTSFNSHEWLIGTNASCDRRRGDRLGRLADRIRRIPRRVVVGLRDVDGGSVRANNVARRRGCVVEGVQMVGAPGAQDVEVER